MPYLFCCQNDKFYRKFVQIRQLYAVLLGRPAIPPGGGRAIRSHAGSSTAMHRGATTGIPLLSLPDGHS